MVLVPLGTNETARCLRSFTSFPRGPVTVIIRDLIETVTAKFDIPSAPSSNSTRLQQLPIPAKSYRTLLSFQSTHPIESIPSPSEVPQLFFSPSLLPSPEPPSNTNGMKREKLTALGDRQSLVAVDVLHRVAAARLSVFVGKGSVVISLIGVAAWVVEFSKVFVGPIA